MNNHTFIFMPGEWLGEGDVEVSIPTDPLKFYAHWHSYPMEDGIIKIHQDVEMAGFTEPMRNDFTLKNITKEKFAVELNNPMFGLASGHGLVSEKNISWEVASDDVEMEGFEIYERVSDDEYLMRAEYLSQDQLRTIIQGRVWRKQ
jgi:hypothetical protein